MIEKELHIIAESFLEENYNISLHIPIKRNNRLRTTLGRYVIAQNNKPLRIEIAGNVFQYGTKETIIGILKHELIHYALHMQGKSSSDGDPYFEKELKKHRAPSTNTHKIGKYYLFTCNVCGNEGESRLKQLIRTPNKYRTRCCGAKLTVTGERIYDGTLKQEEV